MGHLLAQVSFFMFNIPQSVYSFKCFLPDKIYRYADFTMILQVSNYDQSLLASEKKE